MLRGAKHSAHTLASTLSRRESGQHGFTLVEMVMVILVVGMLAVTLASLLSSGVGAFMAGSEVSDTISSLRLSSERIARELRTVRRDPAATADFDFLSRTPTSVQFRRLENDGVTVTTVTIDSSGTNLRIAYNTPAGTYMLSDQLGSLALTYWQQNGVTAATASDATVAFVDIALSLTDSNGNSYPQRTRVALRNRQ